MKILKQELLNKNNNFSEEIKIEEYDDMIEYYNNEDFIDEYFTEEDFIEDYIPDEFKTDDTTFLKI